jgi:hypothetical protein
VSARDSCLPLNGRVAHGIAVANEETEAELRLIRAKVRADGGFTVGCEQLRVLCPDHLTVAEQFARVAEIARQEGWSFAFIGGGAVRFGEYRKGDA